MIFAETSRLLLRALEHDDLPRLTELISDWDVVKWLATVPFPFLMKDAEEFYERVQETHHNEMLPCYAIVQKSENQLVGVVGLKSCAKATETEIGYWLGKAFWGQGIMCEAVKAIVPFAFKNYEIESVISKTDPANNASQNVLRKAGFTYLGIHLRTDTALRGGSEITRWALTRADFEKQYGL